LGALLNEAAESYKNGKISRTIVSDVVRAFHPPAQGDASRLQMADEYWRAKAKNRARWEEPGMPEAEEYFEDYYAHYLKRLDQKAQSLVEGTKVWMRCSPRTLDKILTDSERRIKSQFETGTSGAALNPERRAKIEWNLLGIDKTVGRNQSSPSRGYRPRYSYLTNDPDGNHRNVSGYGSIRICFKEHVKTYTTFIVGDSAELGLESKCEPVPYYEPTRKCFPLDDTATDPLDITNIQKVSPYVEGQILADVSSRDIECVLLYQSMLGPQSQRREVERLFTAQNISFSYL
jgi:hypothetical protein